MNNIRRVLLWLIIFFLGYTFANKMMHFDVFLENLVRTGVFGSVMVYVVAIYALFTELLCLLLLIFKEKIGCLTTLFVLYSYTLYIFYLGVSGRYEVCGCGGILNGLQFKWHLLINLCMIICLTYLYKDDNKRQ